MPLGAFLAFGAGAFFGAFLGSLWQTCRAAKRTHRTTQAQLNIQKAVNALSASSVRCQMAHRLTDADHLARLMDKSAAHAADFQPCHRSVMWQICTDNCRSITAAEQKPSRPSREKEESTL